MIDVGFLWRFKAKGRWADGPDKGNDLNADPEKGLAALMHSERDAVFHARPSRSEMGEW